MLPYRERLAFDQRRPDLILFIAFLCLAFLTSCFSLLTHILGGGREGRIQHFHAPVLINDEVGGKLLHSVFNSVVSELWNRAVPREKVGETIFLLESCLLLFRSIVPITRIAVWGETPKNYFLTFPRWENSEGLPQRHFFYERIMKKCGLEKKVEEEVSKEVQKEKLLQVY